MRIDDINQVQEQIEELEKELPEIPHKPRLWTDSVTIEQLAHLTAENGGRMAILSSEAGIFDILGGQYSNGVANLDLVLKGHAGESYRVDRRNAEPVMIDRAILTIALTPQAGALADRSKGLIFRYRGLDARFLYFMAESLLGRRKLEPAAMREETKRGFRDKIFLLLPEDFTIDRPEPTELELSQEAYEVWGKFYREVEKRLAPGGEFESMKDWGGKLPGAVARIAGLFHILEHDRPHTVKISWETMRQAVYMGCLLSEHAKVAYDLMGADVPTERAKAALAWIRNNRFMQFNARDCGRALQGRKSLQLNKMKFVNEALSILSERGYVRTVEAEKTGTGRKQSELYEVNPAIREEAI